jgi:5-methylcytosine-specific restriction endonuclease McrA
MGVLSAAMNAGLASIKQMKTLDSWSIESGIPKKDPVAQIKIRPTTKDVTDGGAATVSYQQVMDIAMIIDELSYAETTYTNILRQHLFRTMYQIAHRPINRIDGLQLSARLEESFPCQECGILLPLSLMSIDHTRPQSGGESEAVAKVMRVLDLTVVGGVASKSTQLTAALQSATQHRLGLGAGLNEMQFRGKVQPIPTKPGRGLKSSQKEKLNDRYSLNWQGAFFYSLAVYFNCVKELQTRCMHSLVNLRPLCSHCNSSRGNSLKFQNGSWW